MMRGLSPFDTGVDAGILNILESHLATQDIANPETGPIPRRMAEPVLAAV